MSRVQRFREIRHFRIKLTMALLFFLLLLFIGIGAVDYSMSGLLKDKQSFGIFSIHSYKEDYYKISFFDNNIYINTKYITRDCKRLAEWFQQKGKLLNSH